MLPIPTRFKMVTGFGESNAKLNAFDNALLNAGIGNLNILRVSSILPPNCALDPSLIIPAGSLVPTAYGSITSTEKGEMIAAAVSVGISSQELFGVIMEYSGKCAKKDAEEEVKKMVEAAFKQRDLPLSKVLVKGIEYRVKKIGSVIAAVSLWY